MKKDYDYTVFISTWTGRKNDYDGVYQNQCVDLFKQFCHDVDIPVQRCPDGWAQSYWTSRNALGFSSCFEYITNRSDVIPGDWLIWLKGSSCSSSHIGMAVSKVTNGKILVFGQNQGSYLAAPNQMWLTADFAGALRYKGYKKQETIQTGTGTAKNYAAARAGTYVTDANLNIRKGPGTGYASLGILKKGSEVTCYGYYTEAGAYDWYYVTAEVNGKKVTGHVYAEYITLKAKTKALKVGTKIKIRSGAPQYGKSVGFASKVYKNTYTVSEISGNRVVFKSGSTVIGAVDKKYCTVQ